MHIKRNRKNFPFRGSISFREVCEIKLRSTILHLSGLINRIRISAYAWWLYLSAWTNQKYFYVSSFQTKRLLLVLHCCQHSVVMVTGTLLPPNPKNVYLSPTSRALLLIIIDSYVLGYTVTSTWWVRNNRNSVLWRGFRPISPSYVGEARATFQRSEFVSVVSFATFPLRQTASVQCAFQWTPI